MIASQLLRISAYVWAVFGAYWMGASLLRRAPSPGGHSLGKSVRLGFLATTLVLLFVGRKQIPPLWFVLLALAWSGLGLYWSASGQAAQSGEFRLYRPLRLVILAATFSLLFWKEAAVGFLGKRFLPVSSALATAGFAAMLLGLAIALWARIHLGRFWSDKVVLQKDHQLVRTGPYAHMRHPIYSGVLLGVAGTAVVLGEFRAVVAFIMLFVNYSIKARREEKILAREFGEEFSIYHKQAGFLLPKFR